jgi:hypothetical protein
MSRSIGLRAIFDPEAVFYEYAPTNIAERLTVQIRRGTAFTGALWRFRRMAFNREYGVFGLFVVPSRILMLIIFPWMLLLGALVFAWISLSRPLLGAGALVLAVAALCNGKMRYAILSFVVSQVALVIATLRLLFRRHTQIINTVSTARR